MSYFILRLLEWYSTQCVRYIEATTNTDNLNIIMQNRVMLIMMEYFLWQMLEHYTCVIHNKLCHWMMASLSGHPAYISCAVCNLLYKSVVPCTRWHCLYRCRCTSSGVYLHWRREQISACLKIIIKLAATPATIAEVYVYVWRRRPLVDDAIQVAAPTVVAWFHWPMS